MIHSLLTEQRNVHSAMIDRLSTEEALTVISREDQKVAMAVAAEVPAITQAVDCIVECIRLGGHLYYIGAGTSGRLGVLDASECAPTYNVPANLVRGIMAGGEKALAQASEANEDDSAAGEADLWANGFAAGDVLCGIAASGRTPYVLGAVAAARRIGSMTVGISCVPYSELYQAVHIPITPVTGPEVIAGSTRMKAGTATKLVLNMLTTGAMIRLGYTYGNLMVNVQPKNQKLRDRALGIIAEAGRVDIDRARQLLSDANDSVRTAIVMARLRVSSQEAERLLGENGNIVARVLGEQK